MNSFFENWGPGTFDTSWWHLAGWTMCYFLVLGTVVACAGGTLRFLCRRANSAMRYGVSLAVFTILALLPVAITTWLIQTTPDVPTIANASWLEKNSPSETSPPNPPSEIRTSTPDIAQLPRQDDGAMVIVRQVIGNLPWVWIFGAPITFTLLATGLVGSVRLRRISKPIDSGIIADACSRLRTSLQITRQVGVVVCDRIAQPVLMGIVRPLILLPPAALTGWSPDELEMVLLHELAHVRRWDNLVNLLQRIVESVLFFHPAVWLVSRQVRRDREECCDAVVVAKTAKPQAYAELLVAIAASGSGGPSLATASALADHPLTGRIRRILKLEDEPMLVSRNTLFASTFATLGFVALVLWQPAKSSVAEEADVSVAQEEVATEGTEQVLAKEKERLAQQTYSHLRYDGKTFEEWRQMWRTELKTEKRTECISALAAFGRAGRGKEAIEIILDVAGEYDFQRIDNDAEREFKNRVIELVPKNFPQALWFASLMKRYDSDAKKWDYLAQHLFIRLQVPDEKIRQQLLDIANSDHGLWLHATRVLLRGDRKLDRPETVELARKALQGKNPDLAVLRELKYRHLDRVPEQFDLFFHENSSTRRYARNLLPRNDASPLVFDRLMEVLDDPAQSKKHLYAIRALSFANGSPNSDQIESRLKEVVRNGDEQLLGPALAALTKVMVGTSRHVVGKILKEDSLSTNREHALSENRKKLLRDDQTVEKLIKQERQLMTRNYGRGGMGGLGGGF